MIAVIHQPDFLPYIGFFDRLLHADVLVLLDSAQYVNSTSRSWTNRDKIKTAKGEKWISISVKKAPQKTQIKEIEISESVDWRRQHLDLFRQNYSSCEYFAEVFPSVTTLYGRTDRLLTDFNRASIEMLMELFDIRVPTLLASGLEVSGHSNDLLLSILKEIGADRYLSGTGARAYLRPDLFSAAGIELMWQEFPHPTYPQPHGDFIPYLSSIDLLFNCGIERSRKILRRQ